MSNIQLFKSEPELWEIYCKTITLIRTVATVHCFRNILHVVDYEMLSG